jgi:ATP-dependent Lon protease
MLLDGPPGIGKSVWARRLATLIRTPALGYEATAENASFGIVGSQRAWGNAAPGRLIQTILQTQVGNPLVIVDEVEKAGAAGSAKGQSYSLTDALLPLLEPATARRWSCPFFEIRCDMSWVIWVLTSNSWHRLPDPLLSRCPPIRLPHISLADLHGFALREGMRRRLSETSIGAITEVISRTALPDRHLSLRAVIRMLDRAADLEARPRLQ